MSDPLVKAMQQVERELLERARLSCEQPKKDAFEHGLEVGIYQGLHLAKVYIDEALRLQHDED